MGIHAVSDKPKRLSTLQKIISSRYPVAASLLDRACKSPSDAYAIVIDADISIIKNITLTRRLFTETTHYSKRIFILDRKARLHVAQAYALGATHVLFEPLDSDSLLALLSDGERISHNPFNDVEDLQSAAQGGAVALKKMFYSVRQCRRIDVAEAEHASDRIAATIAQDGLTGWLKIVRQHHEGTYQHCLLVIGVVIDFGIKLGLSSADIRRLYMGAMFHDVGKATIPLAILDKPGRLDLEERLKIETHPAAGYEALKGGADISPEILDSVRHHHEYLDGSGYPDGLCDHSISDIVRILTISDIFAALIERRSYKPPMPREQAYDIIRGMNGKLETALVVAFKEVAIDRVSK